MFSGETDRKHVICFLGKHAGINLILLSVKKVANMFSVFLEYIQRRRRSLFHGNNQDKVNFFLIEPLGLRKQFDKNITCISRKNPSNTLRFSQSVFQKYKEVNRLPFSNANRQNNCNMFSLFLPGKHIGCFPGRQNINMFANCFILGKQTSFPAVIDKLQGLIPLLQVTKLGPAIFPNSVAYCYKSTPSHNMSSHTVHCSCCTQTFSASCTDIPNPFPK